MRRTKAAAAAALVQEPAPEIVQTQGFATQREDYISHPEENTEEITIVPPQNLEAQQEEIPEDSPVVQTQNIASQPEEQTPEIINIAETTVQQQSIEGLPEESVEPIIVSQEEENNDENAIVKTQNIASQQEGIPEDTTIVQTQNIASQREPQDTEIPESSNHQIFESSNPEPEEPESSNLQIFESSNQETQKPETRNSIDQSQIRELIEKQLHSLGINANITFSGNSANIQFENIETNEKPEENLPGQTIADNEPSAEIDTTPTIEEQIEKRKNDRNKKANLIDKFIESKARIVPKKDYHSDNKLSTESIIEDEELFTEQLAKIYIKQGHLEKALETYEKLYLKYPEKNIYFATRIEYVKRLMNK